MGFGDLKTRSGQQALNNYLADKSYIEGFQPSQADVVVFEAVSTPPSELAHALRWYNHISSFGDCKSTFAGAKKPLDAYGTGSTMKSTDAKEDSDDDDSDVDLFGSDTEEEKAEKEAARKQREAENAKKPKKQVIAKSTLVLDIKPWDDETDMAEVEKCVRSIAKDGLLWGASQLIPLAYGIKKLQITCVIEDDKIDTDFLEEEITSFSDHVQSMDIAAFNKI